MNPPSKSLMFLTAGAAGMYCGSCMHDNALAKALMSRQWDVELTPVYTPIRTDEDNVSVDRVFFGGINTYLQQQIPLMRRLPRWINGLFDAPWLIRRLTDGAGDIAPKLLGDLTVSMLRGIAGNQRKEVRRLSRYLLARRPQVIVLSNLLIGGFVPYFQELAAGKPANIPIVAILQGDDIFLDSLPDKQRSKSIELMQTIAKRIDRFVVYSEFYAEKMQPLLEIDPKKISVTPLAINTEGFPAVHRSTNPSPTKTIGFLARQAPEKGLDLLVEAFVYLHKTLVTGDRDHSNRPKNIRLEVAGWSGSHHQNYIAQQIDKLRQNGLEANCRFHGTISRREKIELLNGFDVFSVPTRYEDPKGLYVLEAMAAGVPVVQPSHGAFPEMISTSGGGILCDVDDPVDLANKLLEVLSNDELSDRLSAAGHQHVHTQRHATAMAQDFDRILGAI